MWMRDSFKSSNSVTKMFHKHSEFFFFFSLCKKLFGYIINQHNLLIVVSIPEKLFAKWKVAEWWQTYQLERWVT